MKILSRRVSRQRGLAAVESAIVLPVLLLLMVAVLDFGRVMYASVTVSSSARAGAAHGAQHLGLSSDTSGMRLAALSDAQDLRADGNNPQSVDVAIRRVCRCSEWGSAATSTAACTSSCSEELEVYVEATSSREFRTLLPYPGIPREIQLEETAQLRVQ